MAKRNLGKKIKIMSYNDLLGLGDEELGQNGQVVEGQIQEIPLKDLHTFKNHPFRVVDDEQMEEMVESIKEHGILVPAMARPRAEGGYELLSGHRRHHAGTLAGIKTMPVIIKDVNDDIATMIMVDANIQRENILVSEKAKAYKMKYEAMKHQGAAKGISLDIMGEATGESRKTIQRLVGIATLKSELLDMVDSGKLGKGQAFSLSFIKEDEQAIVYDVIIELGMSLSIELAEQIKKASADGYFNEAYLKSILIVEKPKERKVVFNSKKLDSYFEPNMSNEDIENLIVKLLDDWKKKGGEA